MAGRIDPYRPRFRERRLDPLVEKAAPALAIAEFLFWLIVAGLFTTFWIGPLVFFALAGLMLTGGIISIFFGLCLFTPWLVGRVLLVFFPRRLAKSWNDWWAIGARFDRLRNFIFETAIDHHLVSASVRIIDNPLLWLRERRERSLG